MFRTHKKGPIGPTSPIGPIRPIRPIGPNTHPFDLTKVRLHTDPQAATAADRLSADAFTTGNDIYFGANRYDRRLLMHELAHVAQQQNPGPVAPTEKLEREADHAATDALAGRAMQVQLAAPAGHAQRQASTRKWKAGDVTLNAVAATHVKEKGGLFSGNDQAHVEVSTRGKLAYDENHTTPEDPFRWTRLKDIVDSAHVKIFAVSPTHKFKARPAPGRPVFDNSIKDIRDLQGNPTVEGVHLRAGELSPDSVFDFIYYDENEGVGSLTHELFGHGWLALKGAPSVHPESTDDEKARGTIRAAHKITDPFGNVWTGTVRNYINQYVESLGSSVTVKTASGSEISVPKSPTQQIGREPLIAAFTTLTKEAGNGLKGGKYSALMAQTWRIVCNNYDKMQTNAAARAAGNSDLTFTRDIILAVSVFMFRAWNAEQQRAFRFMLADFTGSRAGWTRNELSVELEKVVGAAPPQAVF